MAPAPAVDDNNDDNTGNQGVLLIKEVQDN